LIDLVAIDGPVGVGKSSVAHALAERFGWQHLDTGAMYRAVALAALEARCALDDEDDCGRLARAMAFRFEMTGAGQRVFLNDRDVTDAIRSAEVTAAVSNVADHVAVREELGRRQKELGERAPSVAEGRDMGTVVFPQARWKFFLDADPHERAQRRGRQLDEQGNPADEAELLASVADRDRRDRERPVGALRIADDAIVVDTTGLSFERVVALLEAIVRDGLEEG
jgi:cytidylate kinase